MTYANECNTHRQTDAETDKAMAIGELISGWKVK